jgi:hypothetical protein
MITILICEQSCMDFQGKYSEMREMDFFFFLKVRPKRVIKRNWTICLSISLSSSLQYYVGVGIERQIGSIRVAIIYVGGLVGGMLVSSIFVPYQVTTGADIAFFSIIAITIVEVLIYSIHDFHFVLL